MIHVLKKRISSKARGILFVLGLPMLLAAHDVPWLHGNVEDDGDGDGMSDAWETKYGLNPNFRGDAELDLDLDGFNNREEFRADTHPGEADQHPDWFTKLYVDALQAEAVKITLIDQPVAIKGGVFEFSGKTYTTDGLMEDGVKVKIKGETEAQFLPAKSRRLASTINRRVRSESAGETP